MLLGHSKFKITRCFNPIIRFQLILKFCLVDLVSGSKRLSLKRGTGDQGIRGSGDQGIRGSGDQGIRGSGDQGIRDQGSGDQGMGDRGISKRANLN